MNSSLGTTHNRNSKNKNNTSSSSTANMSSGANSKGLPNRMSAFAGETNDEDERQLLLPHNSTSDKKRDKARAETARTRASSTATQVTHSTGASHNSIDMPTPISRDGNSSSQHNDDGPHNNNSLSFTPCDNTSSSKLLLCACSAGLGGLLFG